MITGAIRGGEGLVRLKLKGFRGREQEVEAIVDTGYTECLTLPPAIIAALRLRWRSLDRATLADGSECLFDVYVAKVVWDGKLTIGHARALLGAGDESAIAELAREVVAQGLSVREVERRVREAGRGKTKKRATSAGDASDKRSAEVRRLEDRLRKHLGTDVRITQTGGAKGELRVPFYSADDLERLLDLLLGSGRSA